MTKEKRLIYKDINKQSKQMKRSVSEKQINLYNDIRQEIKSLSSRVMFPDFFKEVMYPVVGFTIKANSLKLQCQYKLMNSFSISITARKHISDELKIEFDRFLNDEIDKFKHHLVLHLKTKFPQIESISFSDSSVFGKLSDRFKKYTWKMGADINIELKEDDNIDNNKGMKRSEMYAMKPVDVPGLKDDEFAYIHELEDDAAIVLICRVDLKKCRYERVKFENIKEQSKIPQSVILDQ